MARRRVAAPPPVVGGAGDADGDALAASPSPPPTPSQAPFAWLNVAALSGAVGVALGAFGAHTLPRFDVSTRLIAAWETGVKYQLLHTASLLALGLAARHLVPGDADDDRRRTWLNRSASLFASGIVLFSGSIYGLVLAPASAATVLGPLTPIGGFAFIGGWLCLMGMK